MTDIVFFDKDSTLGEFFHGAGGLYPNVTKFLDAEKVKGRELYVATTAGNGGEEHLVDVADRFERYFGSQQINSIHQNLYFRPDGSIGTVLEDYDHRYSKLSPERKERKYELALARKDHLDSLPDDSPERDRLQERINRHFDYWFEVIHKETGELFDPATSYANPYLKGGMHSKDLHLARRIISPAGYTELRTVMVGDFGDRGVPASDPETPLIVISKNVRVGNWKLVEVMLDTLFSDSKLMPWEIYEILFSSASVAENPGYKAMSIGGFNFCFQKGDHQERLIGCP